MRNRESLEEKTLRRILKQRRIELGLSQRAIASKQDFPHSFISKYETGERFLTFSEVIKMCQCLGLDIHQVVDEIAALSKNPVVLAVDSFARKKSGPARRGTPYNGSAPLKEPPNMERHHDDYQKLKDRQRQAPVDELG